MNLKFEILLAAILSPVSEVRNRDVGAQIYDSSSKGNPSPERFSKNKGDNRHGYSLRFGSYSHIPYRSDIHIIVKNGNVEKT